MSISRRRVPPLLSLCSARLRVDRRDQGRLPVKCFVVLQARGSVYVNGSELLVSVTFSHDPTTPLHASAWATDLGCDCATHALVGRLAFCRAASPSAPQGQSSAVLDVDGVKKRQRSQS